MCFQQSTVWWCLNENKTKQNISTKIPLEVSIFQGTLSVVIRRPWFHYWSLHGSNVVARLWTTVSVNKLAMKSEVDDGEWRGSREHAIHFKKIVLSLLIYSNVSSEASQSTWGIEKTWSKIVQKERNTFHSLRLHLSYKKQTNTKQSFLFLRVIWQI